MVGIQGLELNPEVVALSHPVAFDCSLPPPGFCFLTLNTGMTAPTSLFQSRREFGSERTFAKPVALGHFRGYH